MFFEGYIGDGDSLFVHLRESRADSAEADCERRGGNTGQGDGADAFHSDNSVALCDVPMRETSELRGLAG
jgi:hypothetical protein